MKNKDQIFLEQAYSKVINENFDDDYDSYPAWMHRLARQKGVPVWRIAEYGDEEDDETPSFSQPKEGDVFTGKDGRKWVRVKKADGTLGVKPHSENNTNTSFTQKEVDIFKGKDGRMWVRVMKKDGTLGVKPYNKPVQESNGYQIQKGGTGGINTRTLDEIQIGDDVYSASYDVELSRSVEDHGTFYDDPEIDIVGVWKYDPDIDDSVQLDLQTIDKEILSQIKSAIYADIESDIDNDRYDFYPDEPNHEDI